LVQLDHWWRGPAYHGLQSASGPETDATRLGACPIFVRGIICASSSAAAAAAAAAAATTTTTGQSHQVTRPHDPVGRIPRHGENHDAQASAGKYARVQDRGGGQRCGVRQHRCEVDRLAIRR